MLLYSDIITGHYLDINFMKKEKNKFEDSKGSEDDKNNKNNENKKNKKSNKVLKSLGIISGGGGIAGFLLALSGICLPCVLIPLGFVGTGLLFLLSFMSSYKWWLLGISFVLLVLTLSAKRITVCKDGVCQVDINKKKKLNFSLNNLKNNLSKLNNWKTYVAIPLILLVVILIYVFSLAALKTGDVADDVLETGKKELYANLIGPAPVKGPEDAKVTIIEYSDYFCPGCLPLYEDVLEPVLEKYEGKVRFASVQVDVLMNLGYSSVSAAYCADEQGKYWQMHKKLIERIRPFVDKEKDWGLFEGMQKLSKEGSPEYFAKRFKEIEGADENKFLDCVRSDRQADKIAETTAIFQSLGLNGVPVILINGEYFTGYPSEESLSRVIEAELSK